MNSMPINQKRTFNMFANLKHYSNIKNPIDNFSEKIFHPEVYSNSNLENYKNQIIEQQSKITALENKISSLNNDISLKAHQLLHSANSAEQVKILKEDVLKLQGEKKDVELRFNQEISSMKLQFEQRGIELESINKKNQNIHDNKMKMLENEAEKMKFELLKNKETNSAEKANYELKIKNLDSNNTILIEKNKVSIDEIEVLKKQIEEIELKNKRLIISKEETIKSLQSNIYALENKISFMTSDLNGRSIIEMESKMGEIKSLQIDLEHMRADLQREKRENDELKKLKEAENQKYMTSENKVRNLEVEINKKKYEILNAQSEISRAQNELTSIKTELTRKDDIINKLERKNNENENKLREYEYNIERIKNEKITLERNIENKGYSSSLELKELQDKITSYEDRIKTLETEKTTLSNSYTDESAKVQNLINIKDKYEREISDLKALDLKKSREMEIKLKNTLLDFDSKDMKLDTMIKQLTNELDSVRKEKMDAESKIRDLQSTLAKKELEISKYNTTVNNHSLELEKIRFELKTYKDKANYVENANYESASKIILSIRSLLNLNKGLNSADIENLIIDLERHNGNRNIESFLLSIPKLSTLIKDFISQNENRSYVEIQNNSFAINQLKTQVLNLTSQLKDAQSLSQDYKSKSEELTVSLNGFGTTEATLKQTIFSYQKQIDDLQTKIRDLTTQNASLEEQLMNAKLSMQDTTENIASLDKQLNYSKSENINLQKRLDEISMNAAPKQIIQNDEKFYKPSLKFVMMIFGKEVFDQRYFKADNVGAEAVSPTLTASFIYGLGRRFRFLASALCWLAHRVNLSIRFVNLLLVD